MRCPHCGGQLHSTQAIKRIAELNEKIDDCIDRALSDAETHATRMREGDEVVTKECGLL